MKGPCFAGIRLHARGVRDRGKSGTRMAFPICHQPGAQLGWGVFPAGRSDSPARRRFAAVADLVAAQACGEDDAREGVGVNVQQRLSADRTADLIFFGTVLSMVVGCDLRHGVLLLILSVWYCRKM